MPSGAEMSGTEMQRRKLHVAFFAAYAGAMAAGLLFRGAYAYALLFGGMCAALLWLAWRHVASPSRGRLVAECLFLAVAMNTSYQAMAGAVPIVRGTRLDALLYGIDVAVWGTSPNVWAERFASPWLTEVLSVCYIFFMPLLFGSLLRYFFWRRELLGEFYAGLFTVYGLGFLGYLLVPAMGPYLAYPELFSVTLEGGPITQLNTLMVVEGSNKVDVFPSLHCAVSTFILVNVEGSNKVDVFPSLHCAVSTFILVFAWRHHRREFWLLLAPVVGDRKSTRLNS